MTDIVLVRHGETTWHADDRYAGATDVPLSERGHEQAEVLARWAASAGLTAVWSSDMSRTQDTARPSAAGTGLPLNVDSRLREIDFGDVEGKPRTAIERELPEVFAAFRADPVANHMPGGEDPRAAAARALEYVREIAGTHPDGRVLIVCHTTLIRLMVCSLIGVPLRNYRVLFPFIANGHLNEVRLTGERVSMLSWNALPNEYQKADDL